MFFSDYVGTQLQIWTAVGKQNLERLLAQVGLPLQECKQQCVNVVDVVSLAGKISDNWLLM